MSYISLHFAAMVIALFTLYYILPKRFQPYLLLAGSLYFYYRCSGILLIVLLTTSIIVYILGILLHSHHSRLLLAAAAGLLVLPLGTLKYCHLSIGVPIGISFYTLQLIGYCIDIYRGKSLPEKNLLRFILFSSFFPQILQGPIPRYGELSQTLYTPHDYDSELTAEGFSKILTGLILKYMIANKASVLVDTVFNSNEPMAGCAVLLAGILYSFQLFADFMSCVNISQGTALLFGVRLSDNFRQPYCAESIKDFWRRWHISLSQWLRDYIYIPLGGSRKGRLRTDINLLITFLISGVWHGVGLKFALWGLMHGLYQLIGKYTLSPRDYFFSLVHCPPSLRLWIKRISTFVLVMLAWIVFRANSLASAIDCLYRIPFQFNPSFMLNGGFLQLGLSLQELLLLVFCIVVLMFLEYSQNNGLQQLLILTGKNGFLQYILALLILLGIAIFGTYGFGFDANAFIYGGF